MKKQYLSMEAPNTEAVIDFLGPFPVTVKASIDDGHLWVQAISATQDAPILIDEVARLPSADED